METSGNSELLEEEFTQLAHALGQNDALPCPVEAMRYTENTSPTSPTCMSGFNYSLQHSPIDAHQYYAPCSNAPVSPEQEYGHTRVLSSPVTSQPTNLYNFYPEAQDTRQDIIFEQVHPSSYDCYNQCPDAPHGGYIPEMPDYYHRSYQYTYPTTECTSSDSNDSVDITHIMDAQQVQYLNHTKPLKTEKNCLPDFTSTFSSSKKAPNRRGRPVTYNKPGHNFSDNDSEDENRIAQSRGCRRGAKNILLWKFLLGELRKPNSNHVKWEDERQGIFKFVDTAECSRLWGQMKKKEDMNFEKLSRGIRHYYKDGLMSRRDGIRLVYKFNWERVPKSYWPRSFFGNR